ncbi:MAG: hypothetical protein DCF22_12720 [Leptolyngbya sp.]|nr:MAG: hypothetical protein DCF22_12720 [Leptolyngbya sp.]
MQFKTVLGTSVMTIAAIAIAYPATAQTVPPGSINACTQRVAEDMVVQTRDIEFVSAGPIAATTGVRTLTMRNRTTGQTSQCKVNTIDSKVLSVTTSPAPRPPQVTPPPAPLPEASKRACLQRTAEEMVVQVRDLDVVSSGPIDAESGVKTVFLRNRVTGQTADCRVNTRTATVLSVNITSPRPPQPVPPTTPVPPSSGRPVPPNDPTARSCQAVVSNKIRRSFAEVKSLNFLPETTRRYFVSNGVESIRGEGNFSQRTFMSHRFNYNCNVNSRNGQVTGATYRIIR